MIEGSASSFDKFTKAYKVFNDDKDRMTKLKKLQEDIKKQEADLFEKRRVLFEADEQYVKISQQVGDLEKELDLIEKTPFRHIDQKAADGAKTWFTLTSILKEMYVGIIGDSNNSSLSVFPEGLDQFEIEELVKSIMRESRVHLKNKLCLQLSKIEADLGSVV